MTSPLLRLQMAEGFREVAPRKCERRLLWEEGGELKLAETDFASLRLLGRMGSVDCPVAVDADRALAWAYCCQFNVGTPDYSEIREFDLASGGHRRLARLGMHQWTIWMLAQWPEMNSLVALVATDTRVGAIHIRHHLGVINMADGQMQLTALPSGAFTPIAVCTRRRWIIFHGVEGTQLVTFGGRTLKRLPPGGLAGRGADIHPNKPLALIGGDGLWLWNLDDGSLKPLRDRGQFPRWTPDGARCWFSESSSDLFQMDPATGAEGRVLRIAGNTLLEKNYARPITVDSTGRYVALPLTRMLKTDPEVLAKIPNLPRIHQICVVDLAAREAWIAPGYAQNLAWV